MAIDPDQAIVNAQIHGRRGDTVEYRCESALCVAGVKERGGQRPMDRRAPKMIVQASVRSSFEQRGDERRISGSRSRHQRRQIHRRAVIDC